MAGGGWAGSLRWTRQTSHGTHVRRKKGIKNKEAKAQGGPLAQDEGEEGGKHGEN